MRALRLSSALSRLFESAKDGILILDAGSRKITHINPFLTNLLDYPPEHFLGKELWEIGVLRDKQSSQEAMQELHEKRSIRYEDMLLEDRHGRKHPVEMVANEYEENHHRIIQCNIRDISEDLARRVLERTADLTAANQDLEAFSYSVSHDLRAPLRLIDGFTALLKRHAEPMLDDKGRHYLKTISEAATRRLFHKRPASWCAILYGPRIWGHLGPAPIAVAGLKGEGMNSLKTILLVEDNPNDVELTLAALAEYRLANEPGQ